MFLYKTFHARINFSHCFYGVWFLVLSGCATYSDSQQFIQQNLFNHNPARALELLEKDDISDRNRFLYFADKAMLLRILGKYTESNVEIERAKKWLEEFSATSVTEEGAAFIVNDATRTYIGSPVEQIMLNVYAALNYLELQQIDSARVEILQVDTRLRSFAQNDPDTPLSFDPFARYLSGIIYEDLGEWSDAMIAYRKAYKAYLSHQDLYLVSVPGQLKASLILMAAKVGLKDEQIKYEQQFNLKLSDLINKQNDQGELILTFHNGLAPIKRENGIQMLAHTTGRMVRVAVPSYQQRSNVIKNLRITKIGNQKFSSKSELTENISSLQIKTLKNNMPAITARALVRAAAKDKIAKDMGEKNPLAGFLANIVGVATERADTRSWLSLPSEIQTARLFLPQGNHDFYIELFDNYNNIVLKKKILNIKINKNKKRYLSFHWAGNGIATSLAKQH